MFLRRITLVRNQVRNATVDGVFISHAGLVVLALAAVAVSLAALGYLNQRTNATTAQAERALEGARVKLMAGEERHQAALARLAAAEQALDAAAPRQSRPDGAIVARMRDTFDSCEWSSCAAACDAVLSRKGIDRALLGEAYLKKALALVQTEDLSGAEATVAAALKACGESEAFVHLAADLLVAQRRFPEAWRTVEYASAKYPGPAAQFARANLEWGTGRFEDAAREYEEIISSGQALLEKAAAGNLALLCAQDARDAGKARKYVTLLTALAPVGYRTKLVAGSVESALGDYAKAEKLLLSAYREEPQRSGVLVELALLYQRMGRKGLAEEYAREANGAAKGGAATSDALRNAWLFAVSTTAARPAHASAAFDMEKARALVASGKVKEAAESASSASFAEDTSAEALLFAAALSSAAGNAAAAERLYLAVIERGALEAGAVRGLAATLLTRGLHERARYWAERGLASRKDDTVLLGVEAAAAFAARDYERAGGSVEAYLAAGGQETTALAYIFAVALRARGAAEKQVTAQFERALALDGANAAALNDYAMYLAETGRPADALGLADRLLGAAGRKGYSLDTAAFVNYKAGQLAEARRLADEAMAVEPSHPEVLFHAALVYRRLGQADKAAELLARALAAAGDNAVLADYIKENYNHG